MKATRAEMLLIVGIVSALAYRFVEASPILVAGCYFGAVVCLGLAAIELIKRGRDYD